MYVFAGQMTVRDTEPYDRGLYEPHGLRARPRAGHARSIPRPGTLVLESAARPSATTACCSRWARRRGPRPGRGRTGPGVHAFVTLRDLERLDGEARRGGRAVVIGGGLIGVEVAEILPTAASHVTFVIRETWYFPLALERARGRARRRAHARARHRRAPGDAVEEILRGADGARPRRCASPARGDPLRPRGGRHRRGAEHRVPGRQSGLALAKSGAIEVDEALRTSAPGVWAAGDCANVTWIDGSRRPEQLWYTARDQGRVAAASMAGDAVAYRRGRLVQLGQVLRPRVHDRGLGARSLLDFDNTPHRPRAGRARPGSSACPGAFASERIVCRGERVVGFNMLGGPLEPRAAAASGSTSAARWTGCWRTCTRRSSTRSSSRRFRVTAAAQRRR